MPALFLGDPLGAFRGVPNVPHVLGVARPMQAFDPNSLRGLPTKPAEGGTESRALAFFVNWDDNSFLSLRKNIQDIDVLVPEWLHLESAGGNFSIDEGVARQNEALEFVHSTRPELPIVPLINNFSSRTQDWDSASIEQVLHNREKRTLLVSNLRQYVVDNHFAGINIDFENIALERQGDLVLFMRELYGVFHPLGLEVSQDIPLDDDEFQVKALGAVTDFLVLMAYDEHSVYSEAEGPIASQGWYFNALAKRFKELPPSKYVVALGGYGYDWKRQELDGSETTFEDALRTAAKAEATVAFDKQSLNPTFDYTDGQNVLHHIWFLDAVSAFNQIVTAEKLGSPAGYVLWRLGSEDPTYWKVIEGRQSLNQGVAESLGLLQYGYDVSYDGQGEILRVTATPKEGKREIQYDASSGLIVAEHVTDFPSPYVITRWGGDDAKKIALTFDDGPDKKYTPQILDILEQYRVPATFFVIGINASLYPEILQRAFADGYDIGNHTYTHPNITEISQEQFRLELVGTERLLEGTLGRKALLFRPPYAEDIEPVTPEQVAPLLFTNDLGYYTMGMHIDPHDWSTPGVESIVNESVSQVLSGAGNVVLLHDGGGDRSQTVEALPQIIQKLQSEGYTFVTASELMHLSQDTVMPPISPTERIITRSNSIAFFLITKFNRFLQSMFVIGIILGIARFVFIGTLAIVQWLQMRFFRHGRGTAVYHPSVSVIIPAYNEEAVIVKTVEAILASHYTPLFVMVVDDGSTDETGVRVREAFGNHPAVRLLTQDNLGKASALNAALQKIHSDIVVTLDADTLFRRDTISKLIRSFENPAVAAVAGNTKVGNRINLMTRWQALEYITSQNLDRRAFEVMNCISVVPGAVGAWRRRALMEVHGFSHQTMAEDADLTFNLLRRGYRVAYDDEALAYTEAPATVKSFMQQRFRWMYGTFQTAWKHRGTLFRPRYKALGFFAVPNVFVFQVLFPLISPFMDLTFVVSLLWVGWQKYQHPIDFSMLQNLTNLFYYYLLFLLLDFVTAIIPFCLEYKENWSLLFWLPFQRFFYRQLMYIVAIQVTLAALRGGPTRWNKLKRHSTVKFRDASLHGPEQSAPQSA